MKPSGFPSTAVTLEIGQDSHDTTLPSVGEIAVKNSTQSYNVSRASWLNNFNNNSNANANNRNVNNNSRVRGIAPAGTYPRDLWKELCGFRNLYRAYRKARKHKTKKQYVLDFEQRLMSNIKMLRTELLLHSYNPKPLQMFILRDPKIRKINKSEFRDRIVHHALCNIIEPLFEKIFIYDSYANRKGKGTLNAIRRFDFFKKNVSQNNTQKVYVLKADVRHYFDEVNHAILIKLIKKRINDPRIIWLINKIIKNYSNSGKSMPLGNLTSQFFANIYLNELDYFVKQILKAKYYIRYVDDFVILDCSADKLSSFKERIAMYLQENLLLDLHPDKSRIITLNRGIDFLGLKIFTYHKLIKLRNIRTFKQKLGFLCKKYDAKEIKYDSIYDFFEGWIAYVKTANTINMRARLMIPVAAKFNGDISSKEINRHLKEVRNYKKPLPAPI